MKEWGGAVLPWITILSIPIGGWWAYHNFRITATPEWNPSISVSAEVLPYDGKKLVVVHVRPKNIGKVPITLFGKDNGDISVTLKAMPVTHAAGRILDKELSAVDEIKSLVAENDGEYGLQPGVEYDDVQYFVVPKPQATKYYVVSVELDWPYEGKASDAYNVDSSVVVKVEPKD